MYLKQATFEDKKGELRSGVRNRGLIRIRRKVCG